MITKMREFCKHKALLAACSLLPTALLFLASNVVLAQTVPTLRIIEAEATDFPTVRVTVYTADEMFNPLGDPTGLTLRENGVPIEGLAFEQVPHGVDALIVLDANDQLDEVDEEDGVTRQQKVAAALQDYVNNYFDPEVDRLSLMVPMEPAEEGEAGEEEEENGRFLFENASSGETIVSAVESYAGSLPALTPLDGMLEEAIARQAAGERNRFRPILLLTDGADLGEQLRFRTLTRLAQEAEVPLYVGILGQTADFVEVTNSNELSNPTGGETIHVPQPDALQPLWERWQRQSLAWQISYASALQTAGENRVTVGLGEVTETAVFEVVLLQPSVEIVLAETNIVREGDAPDSPLATLLPDSVEIPVRVTWPNEVAQTLVRVQFLLDGEPLLRDPVVEQQDETTLAVSWDLRGVSAGSYALQVAVEDAYGQTGVSEPLRVRIEEERPLPATPTPIPTPTPVPEPSLGGVPASRLLPILASIGAACVLLLLLVTLFRRWRRGRQEAAVSQTPMSPKPAPASLQNALLERLDEADAPVERIALDKAQMSIGRDEGLVDIVLNDRSVSPLHASLRLREGQVLLYDEGGAEGTYLNFERVGLTPRMLEAGDVVRVGRVRLRFVIDENERETR